MAQMDAAIAFNFNTRALSGQLEMSAHSAYCTNHIHPYPTTHRDALVPCDMS